MGAKDFQNLTEMAELDDCFERSRERDVVLFLHDYWCPISSRAYDEMSLFEGEIALIDVAESRALTRSVETRTGVKHESPQVLHPARREGALGGLTRQHHAEGRGRGDRGDVARRRASALLPQALAAAVQRFEDRANVGLQPLDHADGVAVRVLELAGGCLGGIAQVGGGGRIGIGDGLARARLRINDDLLAAHLRFLHHRGLAHQICVPPLRFLDQRLAVLLGIAQKLLALLDHLRRLANRVGNGEPQLVDEIEDGAPLDHEVAPHGQAARLYDKGFEAGDEFEQFHRGPRPPAG